MKIVTIWDEARRIDPLDEIVRRLNREYTVIRKANPRGYRDSMESRMEAMLVDIVMAMGGKVEFEGDECTCTFL